MDAGNLGQSAIGISFDRDPDVNEGALVGFIAYAVCRFTSYAQTVCLDRSPKTGCRTGIIVGLAEPPEANACRIKTRRPLIASSVPYTDA